MSTTRFFTIEFRLPMAPDRQWASFKAKVLEIPSDSCLNIFEIKKNGSREKLEIAAFQIRKIDGHWVEASSGMETLLAAIAGQAVENSANGKLRFT